MTPGEIAEAIAWLVHQSEPFEAGENETIKGTAKRPAIDGPDGSRVEVMRDAAYSIGEEPETWEVTISVRRKM